MDVLFHAVSGTLLVSALGEKRRGHLLAAALISALPDLAWGVSHLVPDGPIPYRVAHSFLLSGAVLLLLVPINWRLYFGLLLHLLVDLPLHKHTVLYRMLGIEGVDWYRGWGVPIAVALWAVLAALLALRLRKWLPAVRK